MTLRDGNKHKRQLPRDIAPFISVGTMLKKQMVGGSIDQSISITGNPNGPTTCRQVAEDDDFRLTIFDTVARNSNAYLSNCTR